MLQFDKQNDIKELAPGYPHHPEYYESRPDHDPEKLYFMNRGARYENGRYMGGFATTGTDQ